MSKANVVPEVVKRAPKIGEEIDVRKRLLFSPTDLLQFLAFVVCHFQLRGLARECRVPRAAFRPVEAASEGTGVRECGIDNMRVRKAKDEFPHCNTRKRASFSEEAVVCSSLKFEERVQVLDIFSQPGENAVVRVAIA